MYFMRVVQSLLPYLLAMRRNGFGKSIQLDIDFYLVKHLLLVITSIAINAKYGKTCLTYF